MPVRRDHDGHTTTRCPTTSARTSSSPRRCCWPSRSSARRCAARASSFQALRMAEVFFFIAGIGAVCGAVGVVMVRNPFYSVLALVFHLLSLAALFLLLQAQFVAAAQVVVYAGAVMVLYVFVVAYVGGSEPEHAAPAGRPRPARDRGALRAGAVRRAGDRGARLGPEGARHRRRRPSGADLRQPGADRRAAADEVPAALRGRVVPAAHRRRRRRRARAPARRHRRRRGRPRRGHGLQAAAGHRHDGRGGRRAELARPARARPGRRRADRTGGSDPEGGW